MVVLNLLSIQIDSRMPDRFIRKWPPSQQYSASSAYRAFFHGQCGLLGAKELSSAGQMLDGGEAASPQAAGR
jgi:hypothetical protein